MVFKNRLSASIAFGAVVLSAAAAFAHVSVTPTGFAGTSQILTFGVGHGCEGADTVRIEVAIPTEVTTVRALPSAWGEAEIKKDDAGLVTAVVWSKDEARDADDQYYQFSIRVGVPDAPFRTVLFPATQTCRNADGEEITVEWSATPEEAAAAKEGEEVLSAPALRILPPRSPGWNKYTVKSKVTDLAIFNDAQIVWAGDAAYSGNATTKELIKSEDDVAELTEIKAGAEIWVKY